MNCKLSFFSTLNRMTQVRSISCYLCDSLDATKSHNQKKIKYDDCIYTFYKCGNCGSYSLFPKLDQVKIAKLYSKEYSGISSDSHEDENVSYITKFNELEKFISTDSKSKRHSYLDYGCGFNPVTLGIASKNGLDCQGVEFSSEVVEQANQVFPGKVTTVEKFRKSAIKYDYIFFGDVIEHLTEPIAELMEISRRISDDGLLIAQGPLQGALTLSQMLINIKSSMFSKAESTFPPYHVSLASRKGMYEVMKSSNFEIVQFKISEPLWPAQSVKSIIRKPSIRGFAILLPKLIDKALAKLIPRFGSHYFLVAKRNGAAPLL
jgi:SAM-dependent methyltransferase